MPNIITQRRSIWTPARRPASGGNNSGGNNIGVPGAENFGVGEYPGTLPSGFSTTGTYGNYQYTDGSIMCWIPAFFYKIGTGSNGLSVNVIDVKAESDYADETAANAAGYALHRAFKDGGSTKRGFFVDKYLCSNNSGTASSIQNGDLLSTAAAHNPISGLTGSPANTYYGTLDAAKTRGSSFAACSRFIYSALALSSMAHGQAASATTYCAWYDSGGMTSFPKGCNDNALGDTDDGTVSYTSDGYSNAPKTGSGTPFAKTTHNGQDSGVADLNGCIREVSLGLTRDSGNNDFYALKESVALSDLTSGSGSGNDAWGNATHLGGLYDVSTVPVINEADWRRFGSGSNQVLDEATSGNGYVLTGLGLPKDFSAYGTTGTNLFGSDGLYEKLTASLCLVSGGYWNDSSFAGVWGANFNSGRTVGGHEYVGFRAACYL